MYPDLIWILRHKIVHRPPKPEAEVKKFMKTLHGDVFVDIGCNVGDYTRLMRGRFKKIYSIDPNPKYNAPIQTAISNFSGYEDFFIGYSNTGSADSLLKNPHLLGQDFKNDSQSFKVTVKTFDELGIDADLVKIDVEGSELDVIEGMNKHLPKALVVEAHDPGRVGELFLKLYAKGYGTLYQIDLTHYYASRT